MPGGEAPLRNRSLPTLDRLNAKVPTVVDARAVATSWLQRFGQAIEAYDLAGAVALMTDDASWRDTLALTWEFRTFEGTATIKQFLKDQLPVTQFSNFVLNPDYIELQQPYPDLAWIQAMFNFETTIGLGTGVVHLVPTSLNPDSAGAEGWKAHHMYTNLDELKGFPERAGPNRDPEHDHGLWVSNRQREIAFEDREPRVVVIGAGHSGLEIAARLQLLGVSTLVLEKNARVGDNWRKRYEALCLHDPVWYDHLPYIPFPETWPVWTPSAKLADWLEFYARSMEINIWTSSTIEKVLQNPDKDGWSVIVKKSDGTTRTLRPGHVVFAHGLNGGPPRMPSYPGMDKFEGKIIHSTQHTNAREHKGKKVFIIGACTSGHDIAYDHHMHGIDVTMYQRSSTAIMSTKEGMPRVLGKLYWEGSPPTYYADRLHASTTSFFKRLLLQRTTKEIADADRELLDGLQKRGFRVNFGPDGSGIYIMAWDRGGGYYLDTGCSQLIIDGKVKLKSDSQISHFSKDGIVFEDGSELPADVVICATGYGDVKDLVRRLVGSDIAKDLGPVWGVNKEGELNSTWRWSGVPRLYFMVGNFGLCRYHSKHLALQIKAMEEGVYGQRYTK